MNYSEKKNWEFSFDINQELLQKVYGKKNYLNAYRDIQRYLFKHGFDNKDEKQGSCYFTTQKMRYSSANAIIKKMFRNFPWLSECIRKTALYERPTDYYNFDSYCAYLNNSKRHIAELEKYYESIGVKMPLELQNKVAGRTIHRSSGSNRHKASIKKHSLNKE